MAWLLDTNVISEIGRKDRCDPKVRQWSIAHQSERQFLSVITLGEMRNGVDLHRLKNKAEARALEARLERLCVEYEDFILPVTLEIAMRWGAMNCPKTLPTADSLIAATALEHGLTIVTRNEVDFARMGVRIVNPFE
ncbi:MAG: type II toxin-antitoxin system VapC family toxin [Verrucomicrobiaceae bacterium]|nr:type II toxin-antitoxin system VapC family toxin [Verrucomicrobiaceae bacterium]